VEDMLLAQKREKEGVFPAGKWGLPNSAAKGREGRRRRSPGDRC